MPVIRGTPERCVKRMHFLRRLIFGDFQRGVPRRIGRTIRRTLSNGVKIIDMFSYAASAEVFPEQLDERFGEHYRMASRLLTCFLMRLPKKCSPNNRANVSGNTIQWRLGSLLGRLGASWAALEASWGHLSRLGGHLGRLGGILEAILAVLEAILGVLGASWAVLGPSWGPLGGLLGCHGAILEASWALLGRCWGPLGPSWAVGELKRRTCQNPSKTARNQ